MAILTATDIEKRFGGIVALDGLSFEIYEDEILGIIGPNGAGKTTLFNVITGYYQADKGTVKFRNNDITNEPPHRVAKAGIGRTFQITSLFNDLSVEDNIRIGTHEATDTSLFEKMMKVSTDSHHQERVREVLNLVNLWDERGQRADNLSYGDKRRLALGIALAADPGMLLLDEPTAGMNQAEIQQLRGLLEDINDQGVTLVLVEHELETVMELSERVLVLNKGKKLTVGEPKRVQNDDEVINVYIGGEREYDIA